MTHAVGTLYIIISQSTGNNGSVNGSFQRIRRVKKNDG